MEFAHLTLSADELPILIGHRGASTDAPENTLTSFRLALEQGADGIEGDFHLTADGHVVCIHDATTERTAGVNLPVTESTLAQLKELDFGIGKGLQFKNERIPTLEEVLGVLPAGKWFFLEIKDTPSAVEPIAKILRETKADREKVVLISFSTEVVKACRETLPEYRACLISGLKDFAAEGMRASYLEQIKNCGSRGLLFKSSAPVTARWLERVGKKNRLVMAWTVDTKNDACRMKSLSVKFLCTNRPGGLRADLLH